MENLFSKDDLYLYKGVLNFYYDKPMEAIKDFKRSQRTKNMFKILDNEANLHQKSKFTNLESNINSDDDLSSDYEDDQVRLDIKTNNQEL